MKNVIKFNTKDLFKFKEVFYLGKKKLLTVKNPNVVSSQWDIVEIGGEEYEVIRTIHKVSEMRQVTTVRKPTEY